QGNAVKTGPNTSCGWKGGNDNGNGAIDWKGNNWAIGCDFNGHDYKSISQPNSGDKCGQSCVDDSSCSHWTWSQGVCYLKNGGLSQGNAVKTGPNTSCGWKGGNDNGNGAIDWKGNNWAIGCDFNGHDYKSISQPNSGDKCGQSCHDDSPCSHWTWSQGVCYLKNGGLSQGNAVKTGENTSCGWKGENNSDAVSNGDNLDASDDNDAHQRNYISSFNIDYGHSQVHISGNDLKIVLAPSSHGDAVGA
ncbi:hypothetical protein HK099_003122, partial [Clydaea vesicula]